jgi:hypothetical protein
MLREVCGAHFREIAPVRKNRAGSGTIQSRHQIEQSGFSGAGTSEQRYEFFWSDGYGDVADRMHKCVTHLITSGDPVGSDCNFIG